jgi:hypothetical protein
LLSPLQSATWAKWAPAILAYADDGDSATRDDGKEIVRRLYEAAPQAFFKALCRSIHCDASRGERPRVVRKIEKCWDRRIQVAMMAQASSGDLPFGVVGYLLAEMLPHGDAVAVDQAFVLFESFGRPPGVGDVARLARSSLAKVVAGFPT